MFGLVFVLKFSPFSRNFNWENSKRLQEGTLLCLSSDNFSENFIFAIVIDRKMAPDGEIKVQFEKNIDFIYENPTVNYKMLETKGGYFESYRHTLNVLKELNEENFPLKKYILVHKRKVKPPCYLTKDSAYNFRLLLEDASLKEEKCSADDENLKVNSVKNELPTIQKLAASSEETVHQKKSGWLPSDDDEDEIENSENEWNQISQDSSNFREKGLTNNLTENSFLPKKSSDSLEKVPILNYSKWPSKEVLKLDKAQYEVLKAALTREFTIIQGPPGTGKTFMGLKIVKLLLYNRELWYPEKNEDKNCPILIVSYTNHALDQFLERILEFTHKIVRVGSQGESELLEKYRLSNLRIESNIVISKIRERKRLENKRTELKNQTNICYKIIEAASKLIFPPSALKPFMGRNHYKSLTNEFERKEGEIENCLEKWLNIHYDDDIRSNYREAVLDTNDIEMEELFSWVHPSAVTQVLTKSSWNKQISKKHEEDIFKKMNISSDSNKNLDDENKDELFMTEEEADSCEQATTLEDKDKWRLYKFWVVKFLKAVKEKMKMYQKEFNRVAKKIKSLSLEKDIAILQDSHVVGMTCTGAAKIHELIEAVEPQIIIIEEAAEVLETHLITSLTTSLKHLIMIGDHQQLQPKPTVHELAEKGELKVSLFERMVRNGIDHHTLTTQHRMRRCIAQLLIPHIYTELFSHSSVDDYEDIKGVEKNMFFVNHSHMESKSIVNSYSNQHEAKFLALLSKYLILQGYNHGQITILATYSDQMKTIIKEIKTIAEECKENLIQSEMEHLKVTSVDSYQGEENDIILVSFVRSNYEGIGFLNKPNRVCVALSRARKGLYCIGNFSFLESVSDLWKEIVADLKNQNAIGSSVNLICQKHGCVTQVQSIKDFKSVADGGCEEKCNDMLECGHKCKKNCHIADAGHFSYKCEEKCTKKCKFGHPCKKKCHEPCGDCKETKISKLRCGHFYPLPCHIEDPSKFKCRKPCEKLLNCGHVCDKNCGDECQPCTRMVPKTFPDCLHTVRVQCHESLESKKCSEPCPRFLRCRHPCFATCGVRPCPEICQREIILDLPCGHSKTLLCSDEKDFICNVPCCAKLPCGHICNGTCQTCSHQHRKCVAFCGRRLFSGMTCKLFCGHNGPCKADVERKKRFFNRNSNKSSEPRTNIEVNKWKTDYVYN